MGKLMFAVLFIILCASSATAQETHTISGHITDASTGESLMGATIQVVELKTGGFTNEYGFYSVTIPAGSYTFRYSFIGYETVEFTAAVDKDLVHDIELKLTPAVMDEIVVRATTEDKNVTSTEMGTEEVKPQEVKDTPVLFGEQDIIKTIQLLPGISETGEGSSGFFVRGGNPDQNLVLLDEAPVYNASHFFGFFSVFNSDAIKNVKLIKGAAPPEYGGRLSSVMDVRMNEGNNKSYHVDGGLGLIFSRLTVQGPIRKNKGSFLLAGRRTYADIFLKASKNSDMRKSRLYFYDLNLKGNYTIGEKDRLFLSGYFGRDLLGYSNEFQFDWGNATSTLRWNHVFNEKLFLNSTLIYSDFDYVMTIHSDGEDYEITSGIQDINLKEDLQYYINPSHTIHMGINTIRHKFIPGRIEAREGGTVNSYKISNIHAYESAAYITHEYKATSRLGFDYGLRFSLFNMVGPGTAYDFDDNGDLTGETTYDDNETIESYGAIEPRFLANYTLTDVSSVKLSYARNRQYIHLLSNSTAGTPLDIWYPSTNNVGAETADQVAAGYFRNFNDNMYETSIEAYYKDMKEQVDYKSGADILLNKYVESELVFGKGWSYGTEYYLKKTTGRLTGWISYSLSKTRRKFDAINQGRAYPSKYDRTHDISLVGVWKHSKKWTFSATWVFHTGNAVTFPSGKYTIDGMKVNYYTERNGYRMPDYHRLDLGATWIHKKTEKFESSVNFSLYNAYGRKNAYMIYFRENEDNPEYLEAVQLTLFTFFPSITYNFKY